MDIRNIAPPSPPAPTSGMDYSEELIAELDEPPDSIIKQTGLSWSPPRLTPAFSKAAANLFQRRESLLTQQLQSENDHTDEDDSVSAGPPRTLSTHSTWSVASTAELTSDDGHSVTSPAVSPPLPPTTMTMGIPVVEKPLIRTEPKIMGHDEMSASAQVNKDPEQVVEAGLGRKRCISFACGGKQLRPPTSQPATGVSPPSTATATPASPPKRKCALKFVCPTKTSSSGQDTNKCNAKRPISPPPPVRRPAKHDGLRTHRGSDSTVTHSSPRSTRKPSIVATDNAKPTPLVVRTTSRRISDDSDVSTEATRFHEFATSDDEPEEWLQESTCHRSRLTVNDTLEKENAIRRACEEVEEEVAEEEEEQDDMDNEDDDILDDLDEDSGEEDEDDLTDDGFRTDDEDGFAESDSEGEESDEDWWRPGGGSTAATSFDPHDRLISRTSSNQVELTSSIGSGSSGHCSPRGTVHHSKHRRKHHGQAMPIHNRQSTPDLPDSTDFVCGTLDEDRPLEQAFINSMKQREAAKHVARPQDIDPTFPTSDPEMDEEDEEDFVNPKESGESLMHGALDELNGDLTARARSSPRPRGRSNIAARSPTPKHPQQSHHLAQSPAPPRRHVARSPPPRKLFGHSPRPSVHSPAPMRRIMSPPNSRRGSLTAQQRLDLGLASRSNITHTASLPRGGGFMLSKLNTLHLDASPAGDIDEDEAANVDSPVLPKRGAIDIVKGLERKRQRRKERLYAKAAAKAAAKGDKAYKVKPGKGAERMREVGLELQRYQGKCEHILSA